MADDIEFHLPRPDPALRRLEFLVGRWQVAGCLLAGSAGGSLHGVATFEWLAGGFFLVHRWEARFCVGGNTVLETGYEFYDYHPATRAYRAHFFNNLGPYDESASRYVGAFDGDALVVTGPARVTRRPLGCGAIGYDADLPDGEGGWTQWLRARLIRREAD